ncbi:hypothetical protein FQN51_001366 [Onygenales sp. PD_10]|nr:hypothetical protein FQN51_001366 [Onygenales sp. PD_10]
MGCLGDEETAQHFTARSDPGAEVEIGLCQQYVPIPLPLVLSLFFLQTKNPPPSTVLPSVIQPMLPSLLPLSSRCTKRKKKRKRPRAMRGTIDRVKLVKSKFSFRRVSTATANPNCPNSRSASSIIANSTVPVEPRSFITGTTATATSKQTATTTKAATEPAPQIRLADVETRLNMHQFNGLFEADGSGSERLQQQNGGSHGADRGVDENDTTLVPTRIVSNGEHSQSQSQPAPEWSSAVGHAMTGKSGRVIHNLQEDIARLTRECSLHRSRAEEAQRINETLKLQLQNVTDRLRNSEQSHEAHLVSLARKDRKIEDLKVEIQGEKDRRLKAEEDARRTNQIAAQERDEHNRVFAEANEIAGQARNQYETLSRTRSKERAEFQTRFDSLRKELRELCGREVERQNQLTRFDVIIEQKNREIEAERERMERFGRLFKEYKEQSEQAISRLVEKCKENNGAIDEVVEEAREVTGRMKWIMRVKEEVKGAE